MGAVVKLAPDFTLAELTKSQIALRRGIDNKPDETESSALRTLARAVLQPVRNRFRAPVVISSGFRCLALNRAIGSKDTSQHLRGEAADFEVLGHANAEVAAWIRANLEFDQLILEYWSAGEPNAGWIHCSYVNPGGNRRQTLTIAAAGVSTGLPADEQVAV